MAASCIIAPTVRDSAGDLVPSRLYDDLLKWSGDARFAQGVWALTRLPGFRETYGGLKLDSNGDVTFESLSKEVDLKGMFVDGVNVNERLREIGAMDSKGNARTFRKLEDIADRVVESNAKDGTVVARIDGTPKGWQVSAEKVGTGNATLASEVAFGVSALDGMRKILRSLGFDVAVMDDPRFNGMFSPQSAQVTAEGLRTIIQIAHGERGEEAFPEEFSHAMIAGLRNTQLVQRLLGLLGSDAAVRRILGDSYADYNNLYRGDRARLAEEAAGKLLADSIMGRDAGAATAGETTLIGRIWNFIKGLFSRASASDVDAVLAAAAETASELAEGVTDGSLLRLYNVNDAMEAGEMYSVRAEADSLAALAQEALDKMRLKRRDLHEHGKEGYERIRKMEDLVTRHEYVKGCSLFMSDAVRQMQDLYDDLRTIRSYRDYAPKGNMDILLENAKTVRRVEKMLAGYGPTIRQMADIDAICRESGIKMTKEERDRIRRLARQADKLMDGFREASRGVKFDLVYDYLSHFWNGDVTIDIGPNKGKTVTLEMLMTMSTRDISLMDSLWSSMSSCGDAFLSLIDKAFNTHLYDRDERNRKVLQRVRAIEERRSQKGFSSDFMYERGADGKLTGRFISPVDYGRFYAARNARLKELESRGLEDDEVQAEMDSWDDENTEWVEVTPGRSERMPLFETYGKAGCRDHLDFEGLGLDADRLEYYREMMRIKGEEDELLPVGKSSFYLAPQVEKDSNQTLFQNVGRPREYVRERVSALKRKFVRHGNDTTLGNREPVVRGRREALGLDGRPIRDVPIFFTHRIEDMSLLSTDAGAAMLSYASMANNFSEMTRIADMFELMRDVVESRQLDMSRGENFLSDAYSILGDIFSKRSSDSSKESYIMRVLNNYLDKGLYGIARADEKVGTVDAAKVLDAARDYAGKLALGANPFSAAANWMIGKTQFLIESSANEFYGFRDAAWAQKTFNRELLGSLGDSGSANPRGKLRLMNEMFDSEGTFAQAMRSSPFYNGRLQRIVGKGSLRMLISAGYYDLYSCNMLAVLHRTKVKAGGKETNLYDAFRVVRGEDGVNSVAISPDATDMDGNALVKDGVTTEAYDRLMRDTKSRVRKSAAMTQGTYNTQDYGLMHKFALGRMCMQFRQWLPEHINRRYGRAYYDAALGEWREGYYMTLFRFTGNLVRDLVKGTFHANIQNYSLSPKERANLKKAFTEIGLFIAMSILSCLVFGGGGDDDKRKRRKGETRGPKPRPRGLAYRTAKQLFDRELLAVGEFVPWYTMATNFKGMLQQPMAGTSGIENLVNAACVWHVFERVGSGRYKGWNRWLMDLAKCVPGENNIMRTIEFAKPRK